MEAVQLFTGERVCLDAPDPERDAAVEAQWTHDPEYLRMVGFEPPRPLSTAQVKKKYETQLKEMQEQRNAFWFHLRLRADDRLLGFARLQWVEWTHGVARLQMGIGAAADRGQGYGTEAMQLTLRYAFHELNLYRLTAAVGGYNPRAVQFAERFGFQVEARRREALFYAGQRWDMVMLGLLRDEWKQAG